MNNQSVGLNNLKPSPGARKNRKVLGRGQGSGRGGTSTKGHKGQNCRSGGRRHARFEGGQMPIHRRLPKRGFTNLFKVSFQVINLKQLGEFDGEVTVQMLNDKGFNSREQKIKILGQGELKKPLTVHANCFSGSAIEKIEKSGGKAVVVK